MKKILILTLLLTMSLVLNACSSPNAVLVYNPYEGIDWNNIEQSRAALHNHSTYSDGSLDPHEVVDTYDDLGFNILAITDHDIDTEPKITFPWTEFSTLRSHYENRDSEALEMLSISGVEYSHHHHMNALFTDYLPGRDYDEKALVDHVDNAEDALIWFAHPGRYWSAFDEYEEGEEFSPSWYLSFFNDYPLETLIGLEVFSQRDRFDYDRVLWDTLLTETMPNRPIFGLSVDDFHGSYAGYSFTDHLVTDLMDENEFKETLLNGRFFAVSRIEQDDTVPTIESIIVDEDNKTIEIIASNYDRIRWVSGITEEGYHSKVVGEGNIFDYSNFDLSYVRAEVIAGAEGSSFLRQTFTQPFGFEQED